jgi:hypothetical protein
MNATHIDAMRRALISAASRRGLLAALGGGLVTAGPFGLSGEDADAKRASKRRRKRKHQAKRNKRKNRNQQPPPAAAPVTRVDATCGVGNLGTLPLPQENVRLAQTFTALASGPLVRVDLRIGKPNGAGGDFVLRLSPVQQSGEILPPTNDVLAETSIAEASLPVGELTASFLFANPFPVVAGTTYALVLSRPGGGRFAWVRGVDDLCPGGAFTSPDQTGSFLDTFGDFFFTSFVTS